jgi:Bacterial Ig-like domain (group 3)/Galactose oxidase, central domain
MNPATEQARRVKGIQTNIKSLAGVVVLFSIALLLPRQGVGQSPAWSQLSPSGGPPQLFNYQPTVVRDPATNRLIFYGRNSGGTSEVWVLTNSNGLNGAPEWIQLSPAGGPPPSRGNHFGVYDPAGNRMMIFGGCGGGCFPILNDVWVLTNANGLGGTPTWVQLSPAGGSPTPRQGGAASYDPATNRMIIFGGQDGSGSVFPSDVFPEVWILSNANGLGGTPSWTQLSPAGGPPPGQYVPSSIYDTANNLLVVAGGISPASSGSGVTTNATWVLSNANGLGGTPAWSNIVPEGSAGAPPAFSSQPAVYDPGDNRMIMILAGAVGFDDWILTNANGLGGAPVWARISPTGGPPHGNLLGGSGAVYDTANNVATVLFFTTSNQPWVLTDANGIGKTSTTTTLTSTPNPSSFGQFITITANVVGSGGIPSGTITFMEGAQTLNIAALNSSGIGLFTTNSLLAGSHSITAVYEGDANFNGSASAALVQQVNRAATLTAIQSAPNPSFFGELVTITATVTSPVGVPSGTVTFMDGTTSLGTGTLNGFGNAILQRALSVGNHSLSAVYAGDTNFNASTSTSTTQQVLKANTSTVITSGKNPSTFHQSVTFTVQVVPNIATGNVIFFDGQKSLGKASLSLGIASFTTSTLQVGSHFIHAAYVGDGNFNGSISPAIVQLITKATKSSGW